MKRLLRLWPFHKLDVMPRPAPPKRYFYPMMDNDADWLDGNLVPGRPTFKMVEFFPTFKELEGLKK